MEWHPGDELNGEKDSNNAVLHIESGPGAPVKWHKIVKGVDRFFKDPKLGLILC